MLTPLVLVLQGNGTVLVQGNPGVCDDEHKDTVALKSLSMQRCQQWRVQPSPNQVQEEDQEVEENPT